MASPQLNFVRNVTYRGLRNAQQIIQNEMDSWPLGLQRSLRYLQTGTVIIPFITILW